jgi:hypothetical protein
MGGPGTYQAWRTLCSRAFRQQQSIYKHLRKQHRHVLLHHPGQDHSLAKYGFQITQPGAASSTTDATIGKDSGEEENSEITDISDNPRARDLTGKLTPEHDQSISLT